MIRIAVLDDQEDIILHISEITKTCMHELGLSYTLTSYTYAKNLLDDLEEGKVFDVFLLDVEMPDMNGLEVARKIRKKDFQAVIIYVTNYVEYAIEAFEVNVYRYIPKRMLDEKLPQAYQMLGETLKLKWQDSYVIEKNHQIERIPYNEIYYLQKEGKNTLIIHKNGISKVRLPISDVVNSVNDSKHFIQVDRSYVVNCWHVMSLKDQQILLRNGSHIPVSKPRLKQVKTELMRYWR